MVQVTKEPGIVIREESPEYRALTHLVTRQILKLARLDSTEAVFRAAAAEIFRLAAKRIGLDLIVRNEYQVLHGRADSVYNRLVLEYKRPGALRATNAATSNASAIAQAKAYI